jgi:hypothetical protein
MPLAESDVLDVLDDSVVAGLDFSVGPIRIKGAFYRSIKEHILAGNILVVPGTESLAHYSNQTDILFTQQSNPPPDLDGRAQLLHECTHALVDIFNGGSGVTRHNDELAAYLTQFVYAMRSNSSWVVGPNNRPWHDFFQMVFDAVKRKGLETTAGNGAHFSMDELEPLRLALAGLPYVNYGSFKKEDPTGADGLSRTAPLVRLSLAMGRNGVSVKIDRVRYADPRDTDLVAELQKYFAATDVAGYRARLVYLRANFALCPLGRATEFRVRLGSRQKGDRLSELFYDHLSTGGRALLLRVLDDRLN